MSFRGASGGGFAETEQGSRGTRKYVFSLVLCKVNLLRIQNTDTIWNKANIHRSMLFRFRRN